MEDEMVREGKIRRRDDGRYEIFSQEATGGAGEIAEPGDYFKIDFKGAPYPNGRIAFESRHIPVGGDWYEQIAPPLTIWMAGDPPCEAVDWLLSEGKLRVHPDEPDRYFSAELWGTNETAAKDAVIVLYAVERDETGAIGHIDFNFVERGEFERTYEEVGHER